MHSLDEFIGCIRFDELQMESVVQTLKYENIH